MTGIAMNAGSAAATTATASFSATVTNTCTVTSGSDDAGKLTHNAKEGTLTTETGNEAQVSINCTGPATIGFSQLSSGGISFETASVTAAVDGKPVAGYFEASGSQPQPKNANTTKAEQLTADINMNFTGIDKTKNGDYTATIVVTATPQ